MSMIQPSETIQQVGDIVRERGKAEYSGPQSQGWSEQKKEEVENLPEFVDWRHEEIVTPVKNQVSTSTHTHTLLLFL